MTCRWMAALAIAIPQTFGVADFGLEQSVIASEIPVHNTGGPGAADGIRQQIVWSWPFGWATPEWRIW